MRGGDVMTATAWRRNPENMRSQGTVYRRAPRGHGGDARLPLACSGKDIQVLAPRVVMAALGALLVSLDASLNIALPAVAASFGIAPAAVRWMIICYVGTYAFTAFAGGLLADRFGSVRVFTTGLWLSALTFATYGVASSY